MFIRKEYLLLRPMKKAFQYLREQLADTYPPTEIQAIGWLMAETLYGVSKLDICLGKDRIFSTEERQNWENIIARLKQHEPIQYVLGEAWFDGQCFEVNRHTLIPRPETAELVAWIVADRLHDTHPLHILDIGTGSGCIAIRLAARLPNARVEAWDISGEALEVAQRNNKRLHTDVRFSCRDILKASASEPAYDLIVSNPPYITEAERHDMQPNVLDWEPASALFVGNEDPLIFYRAIARFGRQALRSGGQLYVEINRAYGKDVARLFTELGYRDILLRKDYIGNDRMIKATIE